MLKHLLKATSTAQAEADILAICPYHDQIKFAKAARDTFIENQGLDDLEAFFLRKQINDYQKALGILEVVYREDMRQFFTGIGRLYNVGKDFIQILNTVRKSDNWSVLIQRLRDSQFDPMQTGMAAYRTYGTVKALIKESQFESAGEAFVNGIFPTVHEHVGNQEWPALPYSPLHEGQEIAGVLAGLIYKITGQENYDNLASCVIDQEQLQGEFEQAVSQLYERHNDDVALGMSHMRMAILGLSPYVAECTEQTQQQVTEVVHTISQAGSLEYETIMANLAEKTDHVEIMMAKMKMQHVLQDFLEFGLSMTEVYTTLAGI